MEMRSAPHRRGIALLICTVAICLVLHIATFITILSPAWVVPAVLLLAGAVLCANATNAKARSALSTDTLALAGWGLLVYAVATFIHFYRTTGGASSVGIIDGQYVSEYQGRVIRTISAAEYTMFPNLWTRVMSAWVAMAAVFCTGSFPLGARSER
jgi:hypothetical protein